MKSRFSMAILLTCLAPALSCSAHHSHLLIDTKKVMSAAKEEPRPTYVGAEGDKLPYSTWLPDKGKPDIILIGVHGISGAASDFRPLGGFFRKKNTRHGIYALELRGQGNDPDKARRGDIVEPQLWFDDLYRFTEFVRKKHPEVPIVWHGESLGSIITLNALTQAAKKQRDLVDGLVLGSPIVKIDGQLPTWKYWLLKGAALVAPKAKIPLETLGGADADNARVVGKTTHREQAKRTDHVLSAYSLRLLSAVGDLVKKSGENARALKIPTLVLYGGKDIFSPKENVDAFFKSVAAKAKEKRYYADCHHLLMFDDRSDEVMGEITEWLGELARKLKKKGAQDQAASPSGERPGSK